MGRGRKKTDNTEERILDALDKRISFDVSQIASTILVDPARVRKTLGELIEAGSVRPEKVEGHIRYTLDAGAKAG